MAALVAGSINVLFVFLGGVGDMMLHMTEIHQLRLQLMINLVTILFN